MAIRSLVVALVAVSSAGCVALPDEVANRPDLPGCHGEGMVYVPPRQGPADSEAASMRAIDCFEAAVEARESRELDFTLMGTEGDEFDAVLQTQDGIVDYYRESGIVGEWQIFTGCVDFSFDPQSFPNVANCGGTRAP